MFPQELNWLAFGFVKSGAAEHHSEPAEEEQAKTRLDGRLVFLATLGPNAT